MKRIMFFLVIIIVLSNCNLYKKTKSISNIDSENKNANLQENSKDSFEKKLIAQDKGFLYPSMQKLDLLKKEIKTIPQLTGNDELFYRMNAGIYISQDLFDSKSIPVSKLTKIETSWGTEYIVYDDYYLIDYSEKDKSFAFGIGDRSSLIPDITNYKIESGWVKISNYENTLDYWNNLLAIKNEKIATYQNKIGIIDSDDTVKFAYRNFICGCYDFDKTKLSKSISKKYGLSFQEPNENTVFDYNLDINSNNKDIYNVGEHGRLSYSSYSVYVNAYKNVDIEKIQNSYPGSILLEFIPEDSKDYFALVLVKEEALWKVCLTINGFSDI